MGVDSRHPQYDEFLGYWSKMRDCAGGAAKVKSAKKPGQTVTTDLDGETYLPTLAGQKSDDYAKYKKRAWWYPATGRTIQGYLGTIFRKPENTELNGLEQFQDDINGQGTSLISFARDCVYECLETGRVIIVCSFVDSKPVLKLFTAEQLINWRDGEFYVFATYKVDIEDYEWKATEQRFVVKRDENGGWFHETWTRASGPGGDFVKDETSQAYFIARDENLKDCPVIVSGWSSVSAEPEYPPLLELAELNLSHYRNTADHENAIHFCGLPQPWASGLRAKEGEVFNIGVPEVWLIQDPSGQAGYAEMQGTGVQKIADAMLDKERRMAAIGARMLEGQRNQVEAAETARIRQAGEMGSLTTIANTCSEAIKEALGILAIFIGEDPKAIEFELNTDFVDAQLSTQEMVQLMQVWQGGGISQDTYLWNLHRGERLEGSIEDEKLRIQSEDPLKPTLAEAKED